MGEQPRIKRLRKAAGPERKTYFDPGDIDRVMAVLLALVSEVASIRERLDTHERIGNKGAPPATDLVEAYNPDAPVENEREEWRDAYLRRLFRVITEDIEKLTPGDKSI